MDYWQSQFFQDGGRYHVETSLDWFLYNNDLRHERVNDTMK